MNLLQTHRSWHELLRDPARDRHLVQFYEDPSFLQHAVGLWTAQSLARGGGAVLVTTPDHGRLVRAALEQDGLDPSGLEGEGRLAVVDADTLMSQFIRDGRPDAAQFHQAIGAVVDRVRQASGGPDKAEVRAWGEMVNLLWNRGNLAGAQRLELLWNEAIDRKDLWLLCSYRVANLDPATYRGLLRNLTVGHSQLIPQADYARLDEAVSKGLADVFGPTEAQVLYALFSARQSSGLGMPAGEAVLVGMHEMLPQVGERVLARARYHHGVTP